MVDSGKMESEANGHRQDTRTARSSDSSHGPETESIRPAPRSNLGGGGDDNAMYRPTSHVSGPDALEPETDGASSRTGGDPYREAGDDIYERLTRSRKAIIVAVLSFCAFLSPVSSTSVLAATPEVAAEYHTTGSVINASNAGYMAFMGISPIIWGPMSQVFGRRPVSLAPNLELFRQPSIGSGQGGHQDKFGWISSDTVTGRTHQCCWFLCIESRDSTGPEPCGILCFPSLLGRGRHVVHSHRRSFSRVSSLKSVRKLLKLGISYHFALPS